MAVPMTWVDVPGSSRSEYQALAGTDLRAEGPTIKKLWPRDVGCRIDAPDDRRRLKPNLVARDALGRDVIGVHKVGAAERLLHARQLNRRRVHNLNVVSRSVVEVVLVATRHDREKIAVPVLEHETGGAHFGFDSFGKGQCKGLPEDVGRQIIGGEHGGEAVAQLLEAVDPEIFAALILFVVRPWWRSLGIDHAVVVGLQSVGVADGAQIAELRPAVGRVHRRSQGDIGMRDMAQ